MARVPAVVRELQERWALRLGSPFEGEDVTCAWVAPATRADGTTAVLKISMPHMEGEQEIEGLRFWNGDPTVRLIDADEALGAMLLECCEPGTSLRSLPEEEQDVVIADLLRRAWRAADRPGRFRHLSEMAGYWTAETRAAESQWADRALVRDGLQLFAELSRSAADD